MPPQFVFVHSFICSFSGHYPCTVWSLRECRWIEPAGLGPLDLGLGPRAFRFTHRMFLADHRDRHTDVRNRLTLAQIT